MPIEFRRVPAIDKCFAILGLFTTNEQPLGISEISKELLLNKSTVFNIVHTLADLNVLENGLNGKFRLGTHLFTLGRIAGNRSQLIQTVRPFLETVNQKTKLSAFLGIRSGLNAIIIDKVDSAYEIKISSEVGMRLPLLAGAGGKALLSLLPDDEIDKILSGNELKKFTSHTNVEPSAYKKEILETRKAGICFESEEYIEGVIAFAVPLITYQRDLQAAVWAVGLKHQLNKQRFPEISNFLKDIAAEINQRFSVMI